MRPGLTAKTRRHRKATSDAIRRMVEPCPACARKQIPRKVDVSGFGGLVWVCRYCRAEWSARPLS